MIYGLKGEAGRGRREEWEGERREYFSKLDVKSDVSESTWIKIKKMRKKNT